MHAEPIASAMPVPMDGVLRRAMRAFRVLRRAWASPPRPDNALHALDAHMRRDIGLPQESAWRAAERHLWLP